ncbi:hypothetical protein OPT61_g3350 [Boeremia exigua]|uniref:Uncharacterized protein n=1 Tax=Boeremia exigua TaxID=749465 RepID=A0ACC2IIG6_9PLEO|nr:hypothetical protein OPT61_g3350 [Boeremia exigua]
MSSLAAGFAKKMVSSSETCGSNTPVNALFALTGKTVVVTGGGRGLGLSLAVAILEAGGHVACLDILPEPSNAEWKTLLETARKSSTTASYWRCDVTSEAEVARVLKEITHESDERGALVQGLVACAGIQQKIPALEYEASDFERILRVNVIGAFISAKEVAKILKDRGNGGSIVLIASMSGQVANRGLTCTAYNSSKSAVHQMCRSLAQEWGQYSIRVNTLSPGYIRTDMTDELLTADPSLEKVWMAGALLGKLGVPDDFKAPAVFLLADGSRFMTGADLRVDGGHCASA